MRLLKYLNLGVSGAPAAPKGRGSKVGGRVIAYAIIAQMQEEAWRNNKQEILMMQQQRKIAEENLQEALRKAREAQSLLKVQLWSVILSES